MSTEELTTAQALQRIAEDKVLGLEGRIAELETDAAVTNADSEKSGAVAEADKAALSILRVASVTELERLAGVLGRIM